MFRFSCEKCGHRLKADEKFVGRTVKCPRCANRMKIPEKDSRLAEAAQAAPAQPKAPPETPAPAVKSEPTPEPKVTPEAAPKPQELPPGYFACPKCGKPLGLNAKIGGRWARCAACGKIADIPEQFLESQAGEKSPARAAVTVTVREESPAPAKEEAQEKAAPRPAAAGSSTPRLAQPPVKPQARTSVSDVAMARFLPPHYDTLAELPDHGLQEFRETVEVNGETQSNDEYAPPVLEGGYGFQLMLSPHKRSFHVFVGLLLVVYGIVNFWEGITRLKAVQRLRAGQTPAWMVESLTPAPPVFDDQQVAMPTRLHAVAAAKEESVPVREGTPGSLPKRTRMGKEVVDQPLGWILVLGTLFLVLAIADVFGGGVLLGSRRDWVASWVFWIAIAAIILECLDLSITKTGYLTLAKPLAWATNILAICGVMSR